MIVPRVYVRETIEEHAGGNSLVELPTHLPTPLQPAACLHAGEDAWNTILPPQSHIRDGFEHYSQQLLCEVGSNVIADSGRKSSLRQRMTKRKHHEAALTLHGTPHSSLPHTKI